MAANLHLTPAPPAIAGPVVVASAIRVVLADEHSLMRRGLRLLLDGEADLEVIAEAVDLASVVRLLDRHRPHVLIIDLSISERSSIETVGELRERAPDTQIVVLSMAICRRPSAPPRAARSTSARG